MIENRAMVPPQVVAAIAAAIAACLDLDPTRYHLVILGPVPPATERPASIWAHAGRTDVMASRTRRYEP